MSILLITYLGIRQPQWMFYLVSQERPGVLFFADTQEPVIALTIDDGPQVETTEKILQVLEQHGVTATFFMLSHKLSGHEALLQHLVTSGHELGHHMTDDEASIHLPPQEFQTKFGIADRALSIYDDMNWFRPGMGWYNTRMIAVAQTQGYTTVLGSLFPYDTHVPSTQFIEWFVLTTLDPGDIVVLHDGPKGRGERTVQLLDQLLPKIQERGYRIVSLTELQAYEQPPIDQGAMKQ